MKQIDYYTQLQIYSLSQFRSNYDYLALLYAAAALFDEIQQNILYLLNQINLDNKEGVWLDYTGWLVGITREYFDIAAYFSYNVDDVNREKFIWFSQPKNPYIVPSGNLQDIDFRARIRAKIGANNSRCTRNENIRIIKDMTFADKVIIKNVAPLSLDITLIGGHMFLTNTIIQDIESVLGQGVGIRNLTTQGA